MSMRVWTGCMWLNDCSSRGPLLARQWTADFRKRWGIAWVAERLVASQEGLWDMEWWLFFRWVGQCLWNVATCWPSPKWYEYEERRVNDTDRKPQELREMPVPVPYRLEHWLWERKIPLYVVRSTLVQFCKTARCVQRPRPVQFFGEPTHWVQTARCLGVTLIHDWPGRHTSSR
jgi:hypothetical protein